MRVRRSLSVPVVASIAVLLCLALCGCASLAPPAREQRLEIFDAVWHTVNEGFYDRSFGGHDWEALGREYRRKARRADDEAVFWMDVLNGMLFELGVSHLVALPPGMAEQLDPMVFSSGTVGMDLRYLDGEAVVVSVREGSPAAQAGIEPGFVIETIDGLTVQESLDLDIQTPPWNERNRRASTTNTFRTRVFGIAGETIAITFRDGADRERTATLTYTARDAEQCMPIDSSLPPAWAKVEFARLDGNVGYIRFTGFLPSALDPVLGAIDELIDAPALIIDIRGNPGGVFPVRHAIASKLVGEREPFMIYNLRDTVEITHLDPVDNPYRGRLVILVDELSTSSSEEFVGSLQSLGRATVVGDRTPGRCLIATIVPLPHGAVLSLPSGRSVTPSGRTLEGNGVVPDIEAQLSRAALLRGEDSQLEAALDSLR